LNHFVSAQQHRLRNREAEHLGSLHVERVQQRKQKPRYDSGVGTRNILALVQFASTCCSKSGKPDTKEGKACRLGRRIRIRAWANQRSDVVDTGE